MHKILATDQRVLTRSKGDLYLNMPRLEELDDIGEYEGSSTHSDVVSFDFENYELEILLDTQKRYGGDRRWSI